MLQRSRLTDIMELLKDGSDLKEILSRVVAAISEEIILCDAVGAYLPEPDGTLRGHVGKPEEIDGIKLTDMIVDPKTDRLAEEILSEGHSVYIPDTSKDDRPDPRPINLFGIKSLLAIPIAAANTVFGVVFLFNYNSPLVLTNAQIQTVESYVDMAAVAIQNSGLLNNTRELLAEKQLLLELIRKLSYCTHAEKAMEIGFHYVSRVLKNPNIGAHLYDDVLGRFRPVKLSGTSKWTETDWKDVHKKEKLDYDNDEMFKEVIRTKQAVVVPDVSRDSRPNRKLCEAFGIKGVFMMPLVAANQILGVVAVVNFELAEAFSTRQVELAQMIVDATAISVSNLRRMESLEWAVERRTRELQEINMRMEHQAGHDILTGLPNRRKYHENLKGALFHAKQNGEELALLFLDLDEFKNINDILGHDVGDSLLIEVGRRLQQCVQGNAIYRMGGDEFTIVLPHVTGADRVKDVCRSVLEAFESPFMVSEYEIRTSFSIGVSVSPLDGDDVESLTKHADIAMYRAKELGGGRFQFYSPKMSLLRSGRLELEKELRKALDAGQLLLHYQPIIELQTGKMTGVEALIRWQHPKQGLLYPDRFIPYAEHSNLILPIGRWVLETACMQNKAWHDAGLGAFDVSINLSARQLLDSGFELVVQNALKKSGMSPENLKLEITESMILQRVDAVVDVIRNLRRSGSQILIDDFGTGYSSLSHLKHFPVDALKIDKSFTRDLANSPKNSSIVTAILAFSKSLNLRSVAEGIETEDDFAFLRSAGCEEGQGYLFSKPLNAKDMTEFLRKRL